MARFIKGCHGSSSIFFGFLPILGFSLPRVASPARLAFLTCSSVTARTLCGPDAGSPPARPRRRSAWPRRVPRPSRRRRTTRQHYVASAGGLDLPDAGSVVGAWDGHEGPAADGAALHRGGVEVGQPDGAAGVGAGELWYVGGEESKDNGEEHRIVSDLARRQ